MSNPREMTITWAHTSLGIVGNLFVAAEVEEGPWMTPSAFWGRIATLLQVHPTIDHVGLTNLRTQSKHHLSRELIEGLRTDTVDTIRKLLGPSELTFATPSLRGGYATIAHSFGDHVALFRSGALASCPLCGQRIVVYERLVHCDVELEVVRDGPLALVSVEALLASSAERFFFPWSWNPTSPWVSRDQLVRLLQDWRQKVTS